MHVPDGEWVEFDVDEPGGVLHALAWRFAEEAGDAEWTVSDGWTVSVPAGGAGDAGLTEADGMLVPQRLGVLPQNGTSGGPVTVRCTSRGNLRLDALVVQPAVATAVYELGSGAAVLYANSRDDDARVEPLATGDGRAYDADGSQHGQAARSGRVRVRGGGFTITGV